MSNPIVEVVWKDEGDFGHIFTFRLSHVKWAQEHPEELGLPYEFDIGPTHGSQAEAMALASEHGARFVEA